MTTHTHPTTQHNMDLTQAMNHLSVSATVTDEGFTERLRNLSYADFLLKFGHSGIVSKDDPYFKRVFEDGQVVKNLVDHMNQALADNTEGSLADDTFIRLFICLSLSFNAISAHGIGLGWHGFLNALVYDDAYDRAISEEHGNLLCNYPHQHDLPEKIVTAIPLSSEEVAETMAMMGWGLRRPDNGAVIPAATMDPISTFDSSIGTEDASNPPSSPNPPSTPKKRNSKEDASPPPPLIKSCIKRGKLVVESDSVENCKSLFSGAADHDLKVTEEETKQKQEETKQKQEDTKRTETAEQELTKRTEEETKQTKEQEETKRTETVESTKREVEKTKQMELQLQILNAKVLLQKAQQTQQQQLIPSSSQQQPPPPMIPSSASLPMIPSSSRSSTPAANLAPVCQAAQQGIDTWTPNGEDWVTLFENDLNKKKAFPRVDRLKQYFAPVTCGCGWEVSGKGKALESHNLKNLKLKKKTFRCACKTQHPARLRIVQVPKTADDGTPTGEYSYLFQRHKFDFHHSTGESMAAPAAES